MPSFLLNLNQTARFTAFCVAVAALHVNGCSEQPETTGNIESTTPDLRTYDVRGFLRSAPDLVERSISIEHEDIPGFMPAMTMPFSFRDPNLFDGLDCGDAVAFKISVTNDDCWIEHIRRVDSASVQIAARKPTRPAGDIPRLKEGDRLPKFALIDQNERPISRETYAGKPLLVTFIFTRCAIPNFCPLMSRHFRTLHEATRRDAALLGQVNLLSISFDERDTPPVLAEYAAHFSADLDSWRFATGEPAEVQKLTRGFAVQVEPDGASINHGLATALIDGEGVIRQIWRGNFWKPDEVLAALQALKNQP